MPTLKLVSGGGELQVSDAAFGQQFNESLVHQVITAYRNAGRSGTKAQKTRAEVRGGGKKPWSQKGTGQARAGSSRSPIWVGGGRAFAAKPRSFEQKVNRKMYRGAIRVMLSELARTDRLRVTDGNRARGAEDPPAAQPAEAVGPREGTHHRGSPGREVVSGRPQPAVCRSHRGLRPEPAGAGRVRARVGYARRREDARGAPAMISQSCMNGVRAANTVEPRPEGVK